MKRSIYTLFFTALTFVGYGQAGSVLSLKTIKQNDVDIRPANGGSFGEASTSIGDLNKDSVEDIAVGAPFVGPSGNNGTVYILFMNSNGTVKDTAKIGFGLGGFNGQIGFNARFGFALANLGDIDKDGTTELAVGSPASNGQSSTEGLVWILSLNSNGLVVKSVEIGDSKGGFTENLQADERFGWDLARMPDVDNDGIPELLVGSPYRDVSFNNSGRVYLIKLNSDGTVKGYKSYDNNSTIISNGLLAEYKFGEGLSAGFDIDNNGVPEIIAGAPGDDIAYLDRGAIWILFLDNQLNISSISRLHHKSTGFVMPQDSISGLGYSVANPGDIDGDGVDDILSGSFLGYIDSVSTNLVRILFLNQQGGIKSSSILKAAGGTKPFLPFTVSSTDFSGEHLTVLNDINGDGKRDLVVGVPDYDVNQGQIHILTLDGVSRIGLEEKAIESNSISIFPNPSSGSFSVSLSQEFLHQEMQMVLLDASGRKLWEKKVENLQTPQMELELKQPAGIYYLHCKTGSLHTFKKVLVR